MTIFTCIWCKPPRKIEGMDNLAKHVLTEHNDKYDYIKSLVKQGKMLSKATGKPIVINVNEELRKKYGE